LTGGGATVPTALSARLIDRLRDVSATTQAGASVVPIASSEHKFARVANDPVPAWRGENTEVKESAPTFEGITLQPRSLAVLVNAYAWYAQSAMNMPAAR
jgi:HK97 family phage major capsid protein